MHGYEERTVGRPIRRKKQLRILNRRIVSDRVVSLVRELVGEHTAGKCENQEADRRPTPFELQERHESSTGRHTSHKAENSHRIASVSSTGLTADVYAQRSQEHDGDDGGYGGTDSCDQVVQASARITGEKRERADEKGGGATSRFLFPPPSG